MKIIIGLLTCMFWAQGVWAAQTANCWYPLDGALGCDAATATDNVGILKPGYHAVLVQPVNRYGHQILGKTPEWGGLQFFVQGSPGHGPYVSAKLKLPKSRIFEDVAPRMVDVNGDGAPEIVVVETDIKRGSRLSVYHVDQDEGKISLLAATPFIGKHFRWLAPVGIADFNGDGDLDFAYVEMPHLAKILKIVSYKHGKLKEIAAIKGFSNHQIGQNFITGGIQKCKGKNALIIPNEDWKRIMSVRFEKNTWRIKDLGAFSERKIKKIVNACR